MSKYDYSFSHRKASENVNHFEKWFEEQMVATKDLPKVFALKEVVILWLEQVGIPMLSTGRDFDCFIALLLGRMARAFTYPIATPTEKELLDLLIGDFYLDTYHRYWKQIRIAESATA